MVRIARIIIPNKAHLVSHCSNEGFSSSARKEQLLELASPLAARNGIKMLAWSVTAEMAHYVMVTRDADSLSTFMRLVQTQYTRYVERNAENRKPNRFACAALDNQATLDAIKYVESLPLAQPRVTDIFDYPFSSAAVRAANSDIAAEMLTARSRFTKNITDWQQFHSEQLDDEYREFIAMRLRTGKPIGSKSFISRLEKQLGMNLSRRRGRPPKS